MPCWYIPEDVYEVWFNVTSPTRDLVLSIAAFCSLSGNAAVQRAVRPSRMAICFSDV